MCVITLLKKHMPIFKLTNLHNIKTTKNPNLILNFQNVPAAKLA